MKRLMSGLIAALLFWGGASAAVGEPQVRVALPKGERALGERLRYAVTVTASRDAVFEELPCPPTMGNFAVSRCGVSRSRLKPSQRTYWFLLRTFSTGEQEIPALTLRWHPAGETRWRTLTVEPQQVRIRSLLAAAGEKASLRGLKEPLREGFRFWYWVALGGLAVLLGSAVFVLLGRRRRSALEPQVPAHERALAALEALQGKELIRQGKVKQYFAEISEIVRRYLQDRFALRAPEMTTEEFFQQARDSSVLDAPQQTLLKEFLERADLVKFARLQPAEAEIEATYAAARRFVEETKENPAAAAALTQ